MKNIIKTIALLFMITTLVSCDATRNASNKQKGTVIGAGSGAVIGGVIGNNVGSKNNSALGAIIGAVVGGVAGNYIGDRMDRQAERIEEEIPGAQVERVGEGINVVFDESSGVYFDTNKYAINSASAATLRKLAGIFKEYPDTNILVEGHTDSTGPDAFNMTLSKQRAQSVTSFLSGQGISSGRFTTNWYGPNQPKYDNSTAEGRAKNRRVELAIIANEQMKKEAMEKAGN
ncbi:OmpA family protein [Gelidibacter japonicus]|jgi:outer membrane protein OmpA-like peptidoglycan-associated protein|uniref:OmpA family protein n=1 Tax=Gelidibacter japonicus TaxID=1962232 RepID=UPI0013D33FBC|nr:OmpA family protein [Gelidibacter japonicus]MCL8006169.1 OmpA family protein [Gelidibacter japonicus]